MLDKDIDILQEKMGPILGISVLSIHSRDWVIKNETENFKIEKITAISFSVINIVVVSHHEVS